MIRAVGAPVEDQTGNLEACSRSWWQSNRFPGQYALSGRRAHRQAHACVGLVIAAATPVAVAGPGVTGFSRDGQLCRHQAPLDERHAHPERQYQRQEQNSDAMPTPAFHRAPNMARSDSISKSLQFTQLLKPGWRRRGRRAITLLRSWNSRRRRWGTRARRRRCTAPPCRPGPAPASRRQRSCDGRRQSAPRSSP